MREPPKLTSPAPHDHIETHLRQFCKDMAALTAWIKEAVEMIEDRTADEGQK